MHDLQSMLRPHANVVILYFSTWLTKVLGVICNTFKQQNKNINIEGVHVMSDCGLPPKYHIKFTFNMS